MKNLVIISGALLFLSSSVIGQIKPNKNVLLPTKTKTVMVNPKSLKAPGKPKICGTYPLPVKVTKPECVGCEVAVTTENLTVKTDKMWQSGSTLRVRIDGGTPLMRQKVEQYAMEWTRHVNLRFQFVSGGNAEIIVTFGNDNKSWSYIGRDSVADEIRFIGNFTQQGTMHFGWFDDQTEEEEFRRVILHEFGHALGFKHEHSHPDAGIPWDREKVYEWYASDGWDRAAVDRNIFEQSSRSESQFSQYDPTSIMQYAVDNYLTIGDFSIPWNTQLSATDIAFAKVIYPRGTIADNKLEVTLNTGGDDLRVNSSAQIFLKLRNGAITNSTVSLNNGQGWGNNSRHTVTVPLPNGVAMTDIEECKLLFTSGKQFFTDGPDNWNLDAINIDYVTRDGTRMNLASRSGRPFVRFYESGETLLFRR